MKKIILAMLVLLSTSALSARDWNIPKGSYTCQITAINDENWNPVRYFTTEQRRAASAGFILDDTKIVDAAGLVFTDNGDNAEGTNNLFSTDYENAIYIPKNAKKTNGRYFIGLGHVVGSKVVRMSMTCTKD